MTYGLVGLTKRKKKYDCENFNKLIYVKKLKYKRHKNGKTYFRLSIASWPQDAGMKHWQLRGSVSLR